MSKKIMLAVPEGVEWPVEGRNKEAGDLILRAGFLEAVADASGLSLPWHGDQSLPRLSEDMIHELLIRWYVARLEAGEPRCLIMDELIAEAHRESLH